MYVTGHICKLEELVLICVLVLVNGMYISAQTCGEFRTAYTYSGSIINCDIRLTPSSYMTLYIRLNMYNWTHFGGELGSIIVIDKERNFTTNPQKFTESNFTLHIRDLTRREEGIYAVECKDTTSTYRSTVDILLPETSTSVTTSVETTATSFENSDVSSSVDDTPTNGSKALTALVVALCVVVVVVVLASTVIIVKMRKQKDDQHHTLVNTVEGSVGYIPREADVESVYNEIDIDKATGMSTNEYAEIITRDSTSAHRHLTPAKISPKVPARPRDNTNPYNEGYAVVGDVETEHDKPRNSEHFRELPQLQRNIATRDGEALHLNKGAEYAKVIPKSQRQHNTTQDNVKTTDTHDGTATSLKEDHNEFTVLFPQGKSESLGKANNGKAEKDTRAEYTNIARRSKKQKSNKRTKELLYVEIDHSGSELDLRSKGLTIHLDASKLDTEYTSIDFNKKAFVAPVRKAPSSWYKRRNKKKDK